MYKLSKTTVRMLLCCAVLTLSLPRGAAAMEGYEHRAMGNLAFAVALKLEKVRAQRPGQPAGALTLAARELELMEDLGENPSASGSATSASYGQLVKCVDNFLAPEKMFSLSRRPGQQFWYPQSRSEVAVGAVECTGITGNLLSGIAGALAAGHANHNHFQDDLLVALNMYHSAALGIAGRTTPAQQAAKTQLERDNPNSRDPGRLFGALAVNAVSDHYLQDFFAPGHMVTARGNLTDTLANSTHDLANEKGIDFHVNGPARALVKAIAEIKTHPEVLAALCTRPLDPAERHRPPKGNRTDEECLKLIPGMLDNFQETLVLKGDGRMWRAGRDGLAQRLLMLATEVRSITDIVDAYLGKSQNSFTEIGWDFSATDRQGDKRPDFFYFPGRNQARHLYASLGFGAYGAPPAMQLTGPVAAEGTNTSHAPTTIREDTSPSQPGAKSEASPNNPPPVAGGEEGARFVSPQFSPLIGLQLARESMFNGDRFGRGAVTLYISPKCYLCYQKDGIPNVIPSIGVVYLNGHPLRAYGAEGRLSMVLPNTETTASVYMRRTRFAHVDGENHRWATGGGMRIEQGFTSFLSMFLGVGKDYGQTKSNGLERGWMFSAGANVAFPLIHITKMVRDQNDRNNAERK